MFVMARNRQIFNYGHIGVKLKKIQKTETKTSGADSRRKYNYHQLHLLFLNNETSYCMSESSGIETIIYQ